MAYALEVETRWGVFEELRDRSLVVVLSEMASRLRDPKGAGVLRITNTRTGERLFRDAASLSQHVRVKSAVECQIGTVGSGGQGVKPGAVESHFETRGARS